MDSGESNNKIEIFIRVDQRTSRYRNFADLISLKNISQAKRLICSQIFITESVLHIFKARDCI